MQTARMMPQPSVVEPIELGNIQLVIAESLPGPDLVSMQWEWTYHM